MSKVIYVEMPSACQMCKASLDESHEAYDVAVPNLGGWAILCPNCFVQYRCTLGLGLGQKYSLVSGAWVKTGG